MSDPEPTSDTISRPKQIVITYRTGKKETIALIGFRFGEGFLIMDITVSAMRYIQLDLIAEFTVT